MNKEKKVGESIYVAHRRHLSIILVRNLIHGLPGMPSLWLCFIPATEAIAVASVEDVSYSTAISQINNSKVAASSH